MRISDRTRIWTYAGAAAGSLLLAIVMRPAEVIEGLQAHTGYRLPSKDAYVFTVVSLRAALWLLAGLLAARCLWLLLKSRSAR